MKAGKTLQQLATEVTTARALARDYRMPQSVLTMGDDLTLRTEARGELTPALAIEPNGLMHTQLAERVGIPARYYEKMRTEAPGLLARNVNEWLRKDGNAKRFVRTAAAPVVGDAVTLTDRGGKLTGRAFLGGTYRPLDNYDMMAAVMPPLLDSGLAVHSSEITEERLYIQLVTDKLTSRVITPHVHQKIDDIVQLGLVVKNSEVGCGALSIQVLVYRLVCTNGLVLPEDMPGFKQVHLGKAFDLDEKGLTDETRRLRDATIWSAARDYIRAAVSQTTLDKVVERLNGIAAVKLEEPEQAVELVADRFGLVEQERDLVMKNLITGGDVSQWGLTNAVTAAANVAASYDRAVDLETIGGKVAALSPKLFGAN